MKASILRPPPDSAALELTEIETPEITLPTELKIHLKAAGINPIDIKIAENPQSFPLTQPIIPGCDGAGIVEATGNQVDRFNPGDEVYYCQPGFNGRMGSYAQYVVVDQSLVAMKPVNVSFREAAAAPLVLITAWESLFDRVSLTTGQTVFVPGGAGGVGHVAIQLARSAGARVCTTVSSEEKARFAEKLGADKVIRYRAENVVRSVLEWTGGQGVDIALDTLGGAVFTQCVESTRSYGNLITILPPDAGFDWSLARLKNLSIHFELMLAPSWTDNDRLLRNQGDILRKCTALIEAGILRINVEKYFALGDALQAQLYLREQAPPGKITLDIP